MKILVLKMADKYSQKDPFWGFIIFILLLAGIFIFLIVQGILNKKPIVETTGLLIACHIKC